MLALRANDSVERCIVSALTHPNLTRSAGSGSKVGERTGVIGSIHVSLPESWSERTVVSALTHPNLTRSAGSGSKVGERVCDRFHTCVASGIME